MSAAATRPPLRVEALTPSAFAEFGDVIEASAAQQIYTINEGTARRFHDLAKIDTGADGGRPIVSLFRSEPRTLPFAVRMLERHPLGSQAFIPLNPAVRYLVVVAASPQDVPRVFLARDGQGVNLHRGTWHHPLLALEAVSDFIVVDRGGPGHNCDEAQLEQEYRIGA